MAKPIIKRRISITHAFTDRLRLPVRLQGGKPVGMWWGEQPIRDE